MVLSHVVLTILFVGLQLTIMRYVQLPLQQCLRNSLTFLMLVNMMLLWVVFAFNSAMKRKLNFFERSYLLGRSNNLTPSHARAFARLCVDYWYFCEPESFNYLKAYSSIIPPLNTNYLKSLL